ncbi:cutinase [Aspergillus cavernicola]|uniref:Cutinase n=1 Tax=Aspergillus cavernicola TaxID=176166 RepID=A0ABR4I6J0_9EURO
MRAHHVVFFCLSSLAPFATPLPADVVSASEHQTVAEHGECRSVTVIFARGTTEGGNVGSLTGPPFFDALDETLGEGAAAVQGVDYPADINGYLSGGSTDGARTMASLTRTAASQCPDTDIVLSGYSQGGQLVHLAAEQLQDAIAKRVTAVVIFGDPLNGEPVAGIDPSKVKIICAEDDSICDGKPLISSAHLQYSEDADTAAQFVAEHVSI